MIRFVLLLAAALCITPAVAGNMSPGDPAILAAHGIVVAQSYSCQPTKTCGKITSCQEAQYYLKNCAWGKKLDRDHDGTACDTMCQ